MSWAGRESDFPKVIQLAYLPKAGVEFKVFSFLAWGLTDELTQQPHIGADRALNLQQPTKQKLKVGCLLWYLELILEKRGESKQHSATLRTQSFEQIQENILADGMKNCREVQYVKEGIQNPILPSPEIN